MILNGAGHRDDVNDRIKLLWENPNPTSSFAAQTLELDLSDFAAVYITFIISEAYQRCSTHMVPKNESSYPQRIASVYGSTQCYRDVTVTNTSITFTTGSYLKFSDSNEVTTGTGAGYGIPYRIYGTL